jgi:hypothetical protein
MDTGAECNVQPLNVYQQVTGDKELKKLNKNKDSVLVLANGYEQPGQYIFRKSDVVVEFTVHQAFS